jgi:hypothetical protein
MFTNITRLAALALVSASLIACSGEAEESVQEDSAEIVSRTARFETFVGMDGQFYFDLVAGNGENVLRSEGYKS